MKEEVVVSEKRPYRNHSAEFKTEAVRMVVIHRKPRTEVARNLGISVSLLDIWIRNSKDKSDGGITSKSSESERIRQLERELAQARMERDILKKAVAFFAKENP